MTVPTSIVTQDVEIEIKVGPFGTLVNQRRGNMERIISILGRYKVGTIGCHILRTENNGAIGA